MFVLTIDPPQPRQLTIQFVFSEFCSSVINKRFLPIGKTTDFKFEVPILILPTIFRWSNGETFVGDWKQGVPHGQGEFQHKNGEKYVGRFKQGTVMRFFKILSGNISTTLSLRCKINK